jgi:acylphosphatase
MNRAQARAQEAAEITIEGLVQGVGFRDYARRRADALALGGWVMNLPDGRVRVWAEGPREDIEALARDLARGPRSARVDRLATTWHPPTGHWPTFSIRSGTPGR